LIYNDRSANAEMPTAAKKSWQYFVNPWQWKTTVHWYRPSFRFPHICNWKKRYTGWQHDTDTLLPS